MVTYATYLAYLACTGVRGEVLETKWCHVLGTGASGGRNETHTQSKSINKDHKEFSQAALPRLYSMLKIWSWDDRTSGSRLSRHRNPVRGLQMASSSVGCHFLRDKEPLLSLSALVNCPEHSRTISKFPGSFPAAGWIWCPVHVGSQKPFHLQLHDTSWSTSGAAGFWCFFAKRLISLFDRQCWIQYSGFCICCWFQVYVHCKVHLASKACIADTLRFTTWVSPTWLCNKAESADNGALGMHSTWCLGKKRTVGLCRTM